MNPSARPADRLASQPHRRQGLALMLVLFAIAIASVISLGVLSSFTPATVMATNVRHSAKAHALAESGIDAVAAYIAENSGDWHRDQGDKYEGVWFTDIPLGDGSFSITAYRTDGDDANNAEAFQNADRVTVTATAQIDGVTAQVTRILNEEPATNSIRILFITPGNGAPSPSSDAGKTAAYFEEQGHELNFLRANESASKYAEQALQNHVAFVPKEIASGDVGIKLRDVSIGVVNEETHLYDDFGMGNAGSPYSGTQIEITDANHYITSPLGTGVVTIASSNNDLSAFTTGIASTSHRLARRVGGNPSLMYFQAGDLDRNNRYVPGRRVMLPWGGKNHAFDKLNAAGKTILLRSVEWAAQPALAKEQVRLLMVTRDAAFTPQEQYYLDLFDDWDWEVTTLADDTETLALQAAAEANDAVFISNVSSNALNAKLKHVTVGIVSEEVPHYSENGFSSGFVHFTGTGMNLADNQHPIVENFAIGTVTLTHSGTSFSTLSGTLSPDARILAHRPGTTHPLIAVIERGDTRYDGALATSRRVKLPWSSTGFDYTMMNDDAEDLLRAAIEWAAAEP